MVADRNRRNPFGIIIAVSLLVTSLSLMLSLSGCAGTPATGADPPSDPKRNAPSGRTGAVGRYQVVVSTPSDGGRGVIVKCDTQTGQAWIVYFIAGEPQGTWRAVP